MKKIILIVYLLVINSIFAQPTNIITLNKKLELKSFNELSDTIALKAHVGSILQLYGDAFRFYHELESGDYLVKRINEKSGEYSYSIIIKNSKHKGK